MKTFRVVLHALALADLQEAYRYASRNAPATARRWLNRFEVGLATLAQNPQRCSLAREHRKVQLELRQYLHGRRPNVFRALFLIDGEMVRVLRVLRAQRRGLARKQIIDALEQDDLPDAS